MGLDRHIKDAVAAGCTHADRMLGIQKMPSGYALMIDADNIYFYWLRHDGQNSDIHWNKWAVRKGAIANERLNERNRKGIKP